MIKFKNTVKKSYKIGFILLTVISFLNNKASAQGAASVEVDEVILESLNQTIPVIGRVISLKEADVPAAVIGKIENVLVEVGDKVNAIICINAPIDFPNLEPNTSTAALPLVLISGSKGI